MSQPEPRKSAPPVVKDYLKYSGLGLTMAGSVAIFTWLGHWLDGFTGWALPILTLVGALVGMAGAMIYLFVRTKKP